MSVNMDKWTPRQGDYVWIYDKGGALMGAGRVRRVLENGHVDVRTMYGKFTTVRAAQLSEHPQNRWGN